MKHRMRPWILSVEGLAMVMACSSSNHQDNPGISCAADGVCQPQCAADPDCAGSSTGGAGNSLPGSTVLLSAVVAGQEEVSPSIREVRPGTLWMAQPGALRAEQVGIRWTAQRMSQEAKMGAGTGCARARKQAKAARRTAN